ncbi:hypothetical protein BRADI_2g00460v3 [Brachypodium distachyon]|uniref:Uncharacterized protein n=2 Tax=Brachypodium distachyon TaxID=15368 RepID=A0A2K2D698_BRADI|nr:hypothetical protein BRADI_2g00460v3 [Brachypodium distachyon]
MVAPLAQSPPPTTTLRAYLEKMATPTTMSTSTAALSLKLLVDTKAERVLFAEASKDVVDFLFSLLTLPLATAMRRLPPLTQTGMELFRVLVIKLLGNDSMPGCVASLYASVDKLDDTYYLQPGADKDELLSPAMLSPAASASSLLLGSPLPGPPSFPAMKTFYRCNSNCSSGAPPAFGTPPAGFGFGGSGYGVASCKSCRGYVTDTAGTACPSCGTQMTTALQFVAGDDGANNDQGFVRGVVTYTVMDDLKVAPMSAISGITLLVSCFGVTDLSALQEKTVQLGYNEGLEILKASLQSKTVLTDVFLANKPPCSGSNDPLN